MLRQGPTAGRIAGRTAHRTTAYTVAQVRAAEAPLLAVLPEGALMLRAATGLAVGVARWLTQHRGRLVGARVLLVVGPGNNGGDALFAGAWLARRGVAVRWIETSATVHAAGRAALVAAGGRLTEIDAAAGWADAALDGVLGIGGRSGLGAVTAALFDTLRAHAVPVIAVDLPSGVDADTGETPGEHVRAEVTFTFGAHKVATVVDPAAAACGVVHVVDIGLDLDGAGVPAVHTFGDPLVLDAPERAAHKYTRGVVGVRAGSSTYPGAAVLCVAGAASGVAGMVRFVGDDAVAAEVRRRFPEVVGAGRVQAWAVGSGGSDGARTALVEALADGVPVVADADAVIHARELLGEGHGHQVVLTPHAGELAGLLEVSRSVVEAQPLRHARLAARRFGAVVLLKGPRTLIVSPDGSVHVNATGTPWLATAGAGDVLTGLVAALAATGSTLAEAAAQGAWIHGRAAEERGPGPIVASDLVHGVRMVLHSSVRWVGDSNS